MQKWLMYSEIFTYDVWQDIGCCKMLLRSGFLLSPNTQGMKNTDP